MATLRAFGLQTAFGTGLASIRAARLRGDRALSRRQDVIGADFAPQVCAFPQDLSLDGLVPRCLSLIGAAMHDLVRDMNETGVTWTQDARVVLCCTGIDVGVTAAKIIEIRQGTLALLAAAGWLGPDTGVTVVEGQAGDLAHALFAVNAACQSGQPVLLLAVDSYACRDRLNALIARNALFCKTNPWGFIPGEAACAALFWPSDTGAPGVARIAAIAETIEPVPASAGADSAFTGSSAAAWAAIDQLSAATQTRPTRLLTDWNNCRYRASEFSYAMVRLQGAISVSEAEHPVQTYGQSDASWLAQVLAECLVPQDQAGRLTLALGGNAQNGKRSAVVVQVL